MSKSSHPKKTAPTPNASQIAAVRRLADNGDLDQANQRLAALRKAFPGFKPLLGLAWEVEDQCGTPMHAAARAYAWLQASPQSRAAMEALCTSAKSAGLAAVYGRALQRLAALDGRDDFELPTHLEGALGTLSLAQAEAIDLSRMHLADSNPAASIAVLQGVDHPSARNNTALALFSSGDIAQARSVAEANWQADPDNLFALGHAVRWRCWAEGLERCKGFAAPLQHSRARRPEEAIAQVSGLRFLGDEDAALRAWETASSGTYWREASDDLCALFADLRKKPDVLPGSGHEWFPDPWLRALTALAGKQTDKNIAQWEQQWDALLDTCGAHADYLMRAVDLGDAGTRFLALAVLKQRAKRTDSAAVATLTALLTHRNGPDSARMELLTWMTEEGLLDRKEPAQVWASGELRDVRSHGIRISSEAHPSPFPPQGAALNERVHAAIGARNLPLALELAQQLDRMYPDQPLAITNMAAIKEGLGDPHEEIAGLYRRAYALAPDYLFARCGLARCLAKEGQLEDARALLEGMLEREEFHRSEYRSFLHAQRTLAVASGEWQAVRTIDQSLADLEQALQD